MSGKIAAEIKSYDVKSLETVSLRGDQEYLL
jgi:hypothetical protein